VRTTGRAEFPTRFQLVEAMNPCPCGYHGDKSGRCNCTAEQVQRYRGRVSGPLLDRIDMHVELAEPLRPLITEAGQIGEASAAVRERAARARSAQLERSGCANAHLGHEALREYCPLGKKQRELLSTASTRLGFSARACHRIVKVARTVADLDDADDIGAAHLAEAIGYRDLLAARVQPGDEQI